MVLAVVIAVYNGEKYLEPQLFSIMTQTRCADEVILCDDGSKDGSVDLIKRFISSHGLEKTWKLYCNESNVGYINNFYQGMERSFADIIFLADQDDIWATDKIEKMMNVMENNHDIELLSCRFGLINEEGHQLHGLLVGKSDASGKLIAVNTDDILKAFLWPGMSMAIRKDFFEKNAVFFRNLDLPHDFIFAIFAAEDGGFFQYEYMGCFHRRHGSNVALEEHRIRKLLNLNRKVTEMEIYNKTLLLFLEANLPLIEANLKVKAKYEFNYDRERIIRERRPLSLLKRYQNYGKMRLRSFICDLWLILFGNYREVRNKK